MGTGGPRYSSQVKSDNVNSIGIYWYWVSLQILLPHSAGNSVKVESGNGRPDTVKSENVKNVPSFRAE